jgi:hypothetical protein
MSNYKLSTLEFEVPANWQDQGMLTFTLPSADKNVKPNVILTKERLAQDVSLEDYFERIKQAVAKRGIKDFKVEDERQIEVNSVPAMLMVCSWDVSAMKQMLGQGQQEQLKNVKPGQIVKQVQVSLIKEGVAVNMTASFPAEQFDIYFRPFKQFLGTINFT